jgi:uroporphyrinogen decarboxylase
MDRRTRIQAAIGGQPVDRLPFSLWQHWHIQDRSANTLARATLALANEYGVDLIKLTPSGLYAVEDWAGEHITYPGTEYAPPYFRTPAVAIPADWRRLFPLDPSSGALGRELSAIRLVADETAGETPFMMTIFSPLTLAFKLAGERVVDHLRHHPADLHAGLEIIAQTTARYARAALDAGADGLFFATQLASHHWLEPSEYSEFGTRYDLKVLDPVAEHSSITVLHLHGCDIFFDLAALYPVHAVSWHDQETSPSLAEARELTGRAFLTGLDRTLLGQGPVEAIQNQVHEAIAQTKGQGLILAPSCVIPPTAPAAHLQAVCDALEQLGF